MDGLRKAMVELTGQIEVQKGLIEAKVAENKQMQEDNEDKRIIELENFKKE